MNCVTVVEEHRLVGLREHYIRDLLVLGAIAIGALLLQRHVGLLIRFIDAFVEGRHADLMIGPVQL